MKRYTVDLMDWYGGRFKSFWLKKNALKFANENKDSWLWVDITDSRGNKERIKNTDTKDYYRTEEGEYIHK
jgi:hypothetical protein